MYPVIGSGVAGLVAAHELAKRNDVTLFEADPRLGGHAHTHRVDGGDGTMVSVDSAFLVHNDRTYPTLCRLFDELGVATRDTEMSMSVRHCGSGLQYAGARGLGGLFPTLGNLARPRYLAMLAEVKALCDAIPHNELSIQWDFCHEMLSLDGQPQTQFPPQGASQAEIMARMHRLCDAVPADVELGIHFCYGDFGARHFIEPKDAGRMVNVANDMVQAVGRLINYMHFPVPVTRTDRDYFAPFGNLKLDPRTEIYLGLVHADGGVEAAISYGWKARLEYRYSDLGRFSANVPLSNDYGGVCGTLCGTNARVDLHPTNQRVTFGLGFDF